MPWARNLLLVNPPRPLTAMALVAVTHLLTYWGAAALAWRAPATLAPTSIDAAIPLLPHAIWVYGSEVLLAAAAISASRGRARVRAVGSMLLACGIASLFFIAFPTEVPRPAAVLTGITGRAWQLLYAVDTRVNALPSLHAAFAIVAAAALWRSGSRWRTFGLLWAVAVLGAALATKQHFVPDLLAGIALGALSCGVAYYLVSPYRTTPTTAEAGRRAPASRATHLGRR